MAESTIEHQSSEYSFVYLEQLLPYPQAKDQGTNVKRKKKKIHSIIEI